MSDIYYLCRFVERDWRVDWIEENRILMREPSGLKLIVKPHNLYALYEIFIQQCYGNDFSKKVIIDIGMNNGDSAIFFAKMGANKIIGLEPDPETFRLAVENIKNNNYEDRILPLNTALGVRTGDTVELLISIDNPGINSINETYLISVKPKRVTKQYNNSVKITTTNLQTLMGVFSLKHVDFLKIDCEG